MSQFVDDYFNAYFEWNPSAATSLGLHQYDGRIENYSAAAIAKRIACLSRRLVNSPLPPPLRPAR